MLFCDTALNLVAVVVKLERVVSKKQVHVLGDTTETS
jgi:hypothetical protein